MRIKGILRPTRSIFRRELWCQLIARRPEFRPCQSHRLRNPFSGELITIESPPDAAEVMLGGRSVGTVYWSMSDKPLVNVIIESSALPLVAEWAEDVGGEFRLYSPEAASDN